MNIVKKIILGFSILAITILVVGIGGITGINKINQQLQVVSEDSIPKLVGSYQQILSLNNANQALLQFLNSGAEDFQTHIDSFDQSYEQFHQEIEQLQAQTSEGSPINTALVDAKTSAEQYHEAAKILKRLHAEGILIDTSMVSEGQLFQSQIDSLARWGQRYISSGRASPTAISEYQGLNKVINNIRLNIRIYEKTGDLGNLKKSMGELKGKMLSSYKSFLQQDPKASRIEGVITGLADALKDDTGLLGAYINKNNNQHKRNETLAIAKTHQDTAEASLNNVLSIGLANTQAAQATAASAIITSKSLIIGLSIIGLLIAGLVGWIILLTIRKPLAKIQHQLGELSQGNLTVEFDQRRKDEFGLLSADLNTVTNSLRDILKQMLKNSQELSQVASENERISLSTTKSMDQQSAQLEQTSAAATELEHSVEEVSQHSDATLESVQKCDDLGRDAHKKMEQTHNSITSQSQVIQSAMNASTELAADGKKIDSILETINTIAEQTNLLALNAAIEAARAGDHGRGFAVVADEVRQLASRTQNSTVEIQSMVSNMQHRISSVVTSMQDSHDQAARCVDYARSSNDALQAMQAAIHSIRQMNTQIAAASTEQTHAVQEVSRTLVAINAASTETAKGANQASESSSGLLRIAEAQRALIQRFRT
ncbi:methyl-accepting chemotaxis protein [Neptunomonas sp. CHC150]|uniref:HAMP domain-containing methyl-accepting chemotaxis protein n=1 Tax=Neptunomonas TaxID=75687 RepID=UPI0025B04D91|nr:MULTISPECIES: methyl-accepting chemotaxis protein [Neptunomonas]MDN2660728.1 methyl-accepting chemotaxis protein [Neptunomonas sp. CHC150]MDO6468021.1 methyl-accepting chemotaxis protein [Neptunomonas phycophila]